MLINHISEMMIPHRGKGKNMEKGHISFLSAPYLRILLVWLAGQRTRRLVGRGTIVSGTCRNVTWTRSGGAHRRADGRPPTHAGFGVLKYQGK